MTLEKLRCVDAGSEYCPCYLAETNDCIVCAHLQGKNFCECNWNGVCIYQEFFWNGNKRKNFRETYAANIVERNQIAEDVLTLKINVTKTLARLLKQPGSYIFIKNIQEPYFFDAPMSIMDVDEQKGDIMIALKILGPKTKSLINYKDKILVRGPYWNGIIGLKDIKGLKEKKILVASRGISLAPSILVMKYLLKNNNKITFTIDQGKINSSFINFIKDYIKNLDIETIEFNIRTTQGLNTIKNLIMQDFDLIYSGGSDRFHQMIADEMHTMNTSTRLVITNNNHLCCGEGICGSCSCKLDDGQTVKMCKTQLPATEILEGGKVNG